MRTTLTLDDNLLHTLKKRAAEQNVSFKEMVHQVLQRGLEAMEKAPRYKNSFHTPARPMQPKIGYDLDNLGRTADEQADEELMGHLK